MGLSLSLLMMLVLVPFMKIGPMLRRLQSAHVPVLVEADDYREVVDDLQRALAEAGWKTRRSKVTWMLRAATYVLTLFAAGAIEKLVAQEMTTLTVGKLQVMLHPADLVIVGPKYTVR